MTALLYHDLKEVDMVAFGLATQVKRELGRRIVSGSFPMGELIDDETTLAAHSRARVRIAILLYPWSFAKRHGCTSSRLRSTGR